MRKNSCIYKEKEGKILLHCFENGIFCDDFVYITADTVQHYEQF